MASASLSPSREKNGLLRNSCRRAKVEPSILISLTERRRVIASHPQPRWAPAGRLALCYNSEKMPARAPCERTAGRIFLIDSIRRAQATVATANLFDQPRDS